MLGLIYGVAAYVRQRREAAVASPPAPAPKASASRAATVETTTKSPPPIALAPVPEANFAPVEADLMRQIHARFATGDFIGALRLADEQAERDDLSDAFHAWLVDQLPPLLTSAGWARLKLGDCDEATTYLRRSEALRRSNETAKGLAVCYFKQRNLAGAREQFTYYLEKQPDDHEMRVLYADILESEGRYDEAVRSLETAAAALGDDKSVAERLASMRGKAKESPLQGVETSRNFRIAYRAGDHEDLVSFALETLEATLDEYVEHYDFRLPPAPIEVIFYPADDFKSVVTYGPDWAEGLFDGRVRVPVRQEILTSGQFKPLEIVLRHELVHALLSIMSDGRQAPPWFDEGVAQRLSCIKDGCGRFSFPPTPGGFLEVPAFEAPYTSFPAVKAGRAYRQSLYLVLMLERQAGEDALRQIIGHVSTASDLGSNGLLAAVNLAFPTLHATAGAAWAQRMRPDVPSRQ